MAWKIKVYIKRDDGKVTKHDLDGVIHETFHEAYTAKNRILFEEHMIDNFEIDKVEFEEV